MSEEVEDADMGVFVYCGAHMRVHETGWCTVPTSDKIALQATTQSAAFEEAKASGLPMYGYCRTCYRWIANEPWYLSGPIGRTRKTCPEHDEPEDSP